MLNGFCGCIGTALSRKDIIYNKKRCTWLNLRACWYHSVTLLSVDLLVRSNMMKMAAASSQVLGTTSVNCRWPPISQMLNAILTPLTPKTLRMQETPLVWMYSSFPSDLTYFAMRLVFPVWVSPSMLILTNRVSSAWRDSDSDWYWAGGEGGDSLDFKRW